MDPAPLCKTAILSFIIDKALSKFWNVSSDSRKRLQMILGDRGIKLKKYNPKALKINGHVKLVTFYKPIKGIEKIKKGVSNYKLETQEQVDKVISLNGKLRCYQLEFKPEAPIEFDCIERLWIADYNYEFYSKCSFNKTYSLSLIDLSEDQINAMISKFKQIRELYISTSSISSFDLRSTNISSVSLHRITFKDVFDLPKNLDSLKLMDCYNIHFINFNTITQIDSTNYKPNSDESASWIEKCKGLKVADIDYPLSTYIDYIPPTIRRLGSFCKIDLENIDLSQINKKFPFLIQAICQTPIEMAQELNLRMINPIMNQTKEKFTLRPIEIFVYNYNEKQLNEHPELFEEVEKVAIFNHGFNFDCLTNKIREIYLGIDSTEGDILKSLKRNNKKFKKSIFQINTDRQHEAKQILNCLGKVKKVKISTEFKDLIKEYAKHKFAFL